MDELTQEFIPLEKPPVKPPFSKRINSNIIMSLISLGVTLPFALRGISQRSNRYFRTFGAIGIGVAILYNIDALEAERKWLKEEIQNDI